MKQTKKKQLIKKYKIEPKEKPILLYKNEIMMFKYEFCEMIN